MLQARAFKLNSPRTFSSLRIRNPPWPIQCLIEPKGSLYGSAIPAVKEEGILGCFLGFVSCLIYSQ